MTLGYRGGNWQEEDVLDRKARQVLMVDMFPNEGEAGGAARPAFENGDHAFQGMGQPTAKEKDTPVGVSMNVVEGAARASMLFSGAYKATIVNILTYAAAAPATFATSVEEWTPVYLDNSASIADNSVTLSLSPLDQADVPNPLAGWIRRGQSDYDDSFAGGEGAATEFPIEVAGTETVFTAAVELKGIG